MWVEKTSKGKFKFCEKVRLPNGSYKRASVTMDRNTAATRKAALLLLTEKLESIDPRNAKLKDALAAYFKDQEKTVKNSTYVRNKSCLTNLSRLLGNNILLNNITAGYVRDVLLRQEKGPVWMNEYIKRFKAFIRWCYRNDYIENAKCADKLLPVKEETSKKQRIQDKYLAREELREVLTEMSVERWKLVTEFLALSGMRFGELAALTPEDFTDEGIRINKTYSSTTKETTDTKTFTSIRTIHIQPGRADCIRRINLFVKTEKMAKPELRNCSFWLPGSDINAATLGHLSIAAFDKYLKSITLKVTGRSLTAHALRHTHVSLLAEQGYELEAISLRLGHGHNSKVTREIYLHITDTLKKKYNEQLDEISLL